MPGERERTDTGQYAEEIALEDVLATFDAVEGPAITTSDVAARFDCTGEAARVKLQRLYDKGKVRRRKSGRTTIYWRQDTATADESPVRTDVSAPADDRQQTPAAPRERDERSPAETGGETPPDRGQEAQAIVDEIAAGWNDDTGRLENRRAAALHVLEHAVGSEEYIGKSSDVVQEARERYPVEGQNEETYWRKNIRPVLKEVGEYSRGQHGYLVDEL